MKIEVKRIVILSLLLGYSLISNAQLEVRAIGIQTAINDLTQARVHAENDTIDLPFWDDFSFAAMVPDVALWQSNNGVFVNGSLGKDSPTINVASFDGNDLSGNPHQPDAVTSVEADVLTSKPIDLSTIEAAKKGSVYLSFYWQMQGNGEVPEQRDSLKLEFKDLNGDWAKVFSIAGEEDNHSETFTKEIIQIEEEYFHAGFQFRFSSIGNALGPFDSWHIDYVYLNQDRSVQNESIIDRAIASQPTSIFSQYTMIPYDIIFDFPDSIYNAFSLEIATLQNNIHPVLYSYTLRDTLTNTVVRNIPNSTAPLLPSFGRNTITVSSLDASDLSSVPTDSLYLESQLILDTSDDFFIREINGTDTTYLIDADYNYRLNDTVRRYHEIHQMLAYDDGQAEYAAGLNKNDGQIAVLFNLPSEDTLTHVDIYFPQINPSSGGERIILRVLSDLTGEPRSTLRLGEFIIPGDAGLNEFSRFTFDEPVVVDGEFYLAMQQFTNNYIGIGLDNNNLIGTQKIWVNTEDEWTRNLKVEGIIMIRAGFADSDYVVTEVMEPRAKKLDVFPNPADHQLTIKGDFDSFELMSISGQLITSGNDRYISLSNLLNGLYLLKIHHNQQTEVHKVLVKHE